MSEQRSYDVSINQPWPRKARNTLVACVAIFSLTVAGIALDVHRLGPLPAHYLNSYIRSSVPWLAGPRLPFVSLQFTEGGLAQVARPQDVESDGQSFTLSAEASARGASGLRWIQHQSLAADSVYRYLRDGVYDGKTLPQLFPFALWTLAIFGPLGLIVGASFDTRHRRELLRGILLRGPRLLDRYTFNRLRKSDGIAFATNERSTFCELLLAPSQTKHKLAIPLAAEPYHFLIAGDTGTGKSTLIRQYLRTIAARGEAAVVYDRAGDFTPEFFCAERGDVILNPLDQRCPFWSPVAELETNNEALTLAAALYQPREHQNDFFVEAPRSIFAHLLQYAPDPGTLVTWLCDEAEIDKRVYGTELAQLIKKSAAAQRTGVLSALSMIAKSLRLLPEREETTLEWSARKWATSRQGWVFLTVKPTTEELQIPLITAWIDTMLNRLAAEDWRTVARPVWFVLDELASLRKIPKLETGLTQLRKFKVKMVLGFQSRSQVDAIYGRDRATTILSNPFTKVFLRTSEPESADWISRTIGEQEWERVRETRSVNQGITSNQNQSHVREVRAERAVSPSQIQGLENLCGYLKQENFFVPFSLTILPGVERVPAFIPREQIEFTPLVLPIRSEDPEQVASSFDIQAATDPPDAPQAPASLPAAASDLLTLDHCLRSDASRTAPQPPAANSSVPALGPPTTPPATDPRGDPLETSDQQQSAFPTPDWNE